MPATSSSGAPHSTLRQQERHTATEQATHTERSGDDPDSALAEIEQIERDRHVVHHRCTSDHRLHGVERHDQAQVAIAEDGAESAADDRQHPDCRRAGIRVGFDEIVPGRLAGVAGRGADGPHAGHHRCRPHERHGIQHEHHAQPGHGEQPSGEQRPDERTDAGDRAGGHVGGRQLARGASQIRQQRALRRAERESHHTAQDRQRVDGDRRAVGDDDHRRHPDQGGAHQVGGDHQPTPVQAIGQDRDERCQHCQREVADDAERAECGGAPALVGVHRHRHDERPVSDHRPGEGEVEPSQRRVVEHTTDRVLRFDQVFADTSHTVALRGPARQTEPST
jgi:hypothetical protein